MNEKTLAEYLAKNYFINEFNQLDMDSFIDALYHGFSWPKSYVSSFYHDLKVSYPEDRLTWFNRRDLTFAEIIELANIYFWVENCSNCTEIVYSVEPNELTETLDNAISVDGYINEKSINCYMCQECWKQFIGMIA